jgi:hypothetical protein
MPDAIYKMFEAYSHDKWSCPQLHERINWRLANAR